MSERGSELTLENVIILSLYMLRRAAKACVYIAASMLVCWPVLSHARDEVYRRTYCDVQGQHTPQCCGQVHLTPQVKSCIAVPAQQWVTLS